MRKTGFLILMIFVLVGSFIGCDKSVLKGIDEDSSFKDTGEDSLTKDEQDDNEYSEYQVFEAEVLEVRNGLLIAPDEESTEYSSSDRISVGLLNTKIYDEKGNIVETDNIKVGDRLKIFYNGVIAESYPAQITAKKIEIIGHNDIVDGIFAVIDDIYQEDSALNHDITMIAFDTSDWSFLSKAEVYTVIAMANDKYNLEIIEGTFDELAEQGIIDKENLYFEKGIMMELKNIKINKNRDKINCSISKWRSGLGAIGWDANATHKEDEWKITRDNEWKS